jgi:hypothetical protein
VAIFVHGTYGSALRQFIRDNQPFGSYNDIQMKLIGAVTDPRANRKYKAIQRADIPTIMAAINAAKTNKELKL